MPLPPADLTAGTVLSGGYVARPGDKIDANGFITNPERSASVNAENAGFAQRQAQRNAERAAQDNANAGQPAATAAKPGAAPPPPAGGGALNNPDVAGGMRQPRLRALTDGKPIGGAIEASVTSNAHYQADRFSATFSLYADPAYGPAWWGGKDTLLLDIQASLDGGQSWTSLIIGEASQVSLRLLQGEVHVDGRDLTGRFIDAKTQETFLNQTSSQVAVTLAGRHGMTADVVPTSTPVGRFYTADHDHITTGQFSRTTTEWDLLTFLAQQEGYDVWVSGTVLHFRPKAQPNATPWLVKWTGRGQNAAAPRSNAMDLELDRSLTIAKGLVVEVRSWSSRNGRGFTKTAKASGKGGGKEQPQKIAIQRPNLTEDEAQKLANRILAEESRHERVIRWREPADLALSPRNLVRLEGTGSSWDQTYYVASVQRRLSYDGGFVMSIEAKNHSADSQVSGP